MKRWLLAAALLAGCNGPPKPAELTSSRPTPAELKVTAARAMSRTLVSTLKLSATVAADRTVNLASPTSGRVEFVGGSLGDTVAQGQLMIRVSSMEQEQDVHIRRAQLNESLTKVGMSGPLGRDRNPGELPAVRKARAQLENAEQSYQEYQSLRQEELVSDQALADKRADYLTAKADYETALHQVAQDLSAVQTNQAQLQQSLRKIGLTEVVAPFPAYIQQQGIEVGDYLQAGSQSGLILVSQSPVYAMIDVPQQEIRHVAPGRELWFTSDAGPGKVRARVRRLSPIVTPSTRSLQVQAVLVDPPAWVRPGMLGSVALQTAAPDKRVLVPDAAVLTREGRSEIFVLQNGRVQVRTVKLGPTEGSWVSVQGVRPGEQVAASDLVALKDGDRVAIGSELPPPQKGAR